MIRYVLKRVGIALLTVFTLATVTFFLSKLLPGDPFMNEKIPVAVQEKQRAYYGLDRPVAEQYFIYMGNLLKGDLGVSIKFVGRSVWDIIREFFPVSAKLGLIALVFAEFTGILNPKYAIPTHYGDPVGEKSCGSAFAEKAKVKAPDTTVVFKLF